MGHSLTDYLTLPSAFLQVPIHKNIRESEGPCSSAGVQGAGPLATAERAASPSAEGGRENQREGVNASQCMVPSLSLSVSRCLLRSRLSTRYWEGGRSLVPRAIGHGLSALVTHTSYSGRMWT